MGEFAVQYGRAADELASKLKASTPSLGEAERKVEDCQARCDLINAQGKLISDDELVELNGRCRSARAACSAQRAAQSTRSINVQAVLGGGLPKSLPRR